MDTDDIPKFNSTMQKFRKEQNMSAELKWSKVSIQKLTEYKRFIEYFFALNNTDNIHYHCLIVDNHQINHKKFSQGDCESGFYKFYYQLLLHCFGKKYCTNENRVRLITHLDYRNTNYSLSTLKTVLNSGINKKCDINYDPFVSIEPVDSKKSDLLQICDILLGAMGYQKNGYPILATSKKAKIELADYIAFKAGLKNLSDNTLRGNYRFTIWNLRLKK